jgi:hypothetical protein
MNLLQQRLANKINAMRAQRTSNKTRPNYNPKTILNHIMRDRHIMSSTEMAPKYAAFIKDHQALYSTILLTKDRDYPAEVFQRILDARMDPSLAPDDVEALTHRELAALAPTTMPPTYDPNAQYPLIEAVRAHIADPDSEPDPVIPQYLLVKMQENPFTAAQVELLHKLMFLKGEVMSGRMSRTDADNIYNTENARIHDQRLLFQDDVPDRN